MIVNLTFSTHLLTNKAATTNAIKREQRILHQ